jgi:hypothetical protein
VTRGRKRKKKKLAREAEIKKHIIFTFHLCFSNGTHVLKRKGKKVKCYFPFEMISAGRVVDPRRSNEK